MVEKLKVSISYGDLRADFEGEPQEVMRQVIRFMEENIACYSLASRLVVSTDITSLIASLEGYVGYNQAEGFFLKPDVKKLAQQQQILILLAARKLEHLWGKAEKETMGVDEIAEKVGATQSSIRGRLAELSKKNLVKRMNRGDYALTAAGMKELIDKAQAKL